MTVVLVDANVILDVVTDDAKWGKWSADVFDFVFENWDDYRAPSRVTPTLMALGNIDDWHTIISEYMQARKQREYKAMIARVEKTALGEGNGVWDVAV